jgi:hypothetical protein
MVHFWIRAKQFQVPGSCKIHASLSRATIDPPWKKNQASNMAKTNGGKCQFFKRKLKLVAVGR